MESSKFVDIRKYIGAHDIGEGQWLTTPSTLRHPGSAPEQVPAYYAVIFTIDSRVFVPSIIYVFTYYAMLQCSYILCSTKNMMTVLLEYIDLL